MGVISILWNFFLYKEKFPLKNRLKINKKINDI